MTDKELKELLDREATRINRVEFIANDPVQFPRRYERQEDIEIAALLSATIAWGNRKMICRDADRMLSMMDNSPYQFMMDEGYEDLNPDQNIHRTFFARNLQHYMRGLRLIYRKYSSLDALSAAIESGKDEFPAWRLTSEIQKYLLEANDNKACSRCLPQNLEQTALKRINMALRWLVRDDGIVDLGIWKSIPKRKLYIPLDVHAGNTARELGLLSRKSNDRKAVAELTQRLREYRQEDPAFYDYALFGIGIGE